MTQFVLCGTNPSPITDVAIQLECGMTLFQVMNKMCHFNYEVLYYRYLTDCLPISTDQFNNQVMAGDFVVQILQHNISTPELAS